MSLNLQLNKNRHGFMLKSLSGIAIDLGVSTLAFLSMQKKKIYLSNIFALRATNAFKNEQSFEECAFFHASEIFKTAGSLIPWISLLQSI